MSKYNDLYMGKPLKDMTRDELEDAVRNLGNLYLNTALQRRAGVGYREYYSDYPDPRVFALAEKHGGEY